MAVTPSPPCYISVSFLRHLPPSTTVPFFALSATQRNLGGLTVNRNNLVHNFGDFGARDPYPEEIASQFGDKVLGNQSTEDNIFIPNASAPLSVDDARKPLYKVLGWSIVEDEAGGLKIRCMWKVRDFGCGVELINMIHKVAEASGHFPSLHLESPTQVRAELSTTSIGGFEHEQFHYGGKNR